DPEQELLSLLDQLNALDSCLAASQEGESTAHDGTEPCDLSELSVDTTVNFPNDLEDCQCEEVDAGVSVDVAGLLSCTDANALFRQALSFAESLANSIDAFANGQLLLATSALEFVQTALDRLKSYVLGVVNRAEADGRLTGRQADLLRF